MRTARTILCVFVLLAGYRYVGAQVPTTTPARHSSRPISKSRRYISDVILLKFKEGTSKKVMAETLSGIGQARAQKYMDRTFVVKVRKGLAVNIALKRLSRDPAVEWAERNYSRRPKNEKVPPGHEPASSR